MSVTVRDPWNAAADPAMPFLARALEPEAACVALWCAVESWRGPVMEFELTGIRVIRHKPGRRAVAEFDVIFAGEGDAEHATLVGKARAKGLDKKAPALLQALRDAGFGATEGNDVCVPEPVGTAPEFQMWFQTKVPGTPLLDGLTAANGADLARRVATAAHKLHRAKVRASRRHTMDDELAILRGRCAQLSAGRPCWRERLDRLLRACERLGASLGGRPVCGIHRDFHPGQLLVDGARLWLLDFDLYSEGDPALDLGNFLGHLHELAVREPARAQELRAFAHEAEAHYLELSGERDASALRAYETLTLARHISISAEFPDRRAFTGAILDLCEARLGLEAAHLETITKAPLPSPFPPAKGGEGR